MLLVGCGDTAGSDGHGETIVFAASSLSDAFREIERSFEAMHSGTNVVLNLAGTPTLRTQLEQGARADVFASASQEQMAFAVESRVIEGGPTPFATNRLVIIAAASNMTVQVPEDLAVSGVKLVLALPHVPVGAYARRSLRQMEDAPSFPEDFAALALSNVVSEETNVRQVVAKVALGEADTGMVYATDVTPDIAGDVRVIEIPDELNVSATYPIARVRNAPEPSGGMAFIGFVLSEEGQTVLAEFGFGRAR
jgi:molybdate transport system substrate-binding protein